MSYCINPWCAKRDNPDDRDRCQTCDTPLRVRDRYRLTRPLRELDEWEPSEIFEVQDLETSSTKVLKVLKKDILLPLFEREVITLQQLDHPGIPQVQEDGYFSLEVNGIGSGADQEVRSLYCLIMENIQGMNLDI
ncbi:MAG: protein kinase, partial [Moorea sp. SIO3C2]|nr:protein kinase [Moorena sp. SIO3C2]